MYTYRSQPEVNFTEGVRVTTLKRLPCAEISNKVVIAFILVIQLQYHISQIDLNMVLVII